MVFGGSFDYNEGEKKKKKKNFKIYRFLSDTLRIERALNQNRAHNVSWVR